MTTEALIERIADGRTDLVWELPAHGLPATAADKNGTGVLEWCVYYGDVAAIRFLLDRGAPSGPLDTGATLAGAAFHGHWRLCEFLLERGADANAAAPDTGETPLHSALCTADRDAHDLVVEALLARGADPNRATRPGAETGCFMRDCRTKGETPLHRAAAFGGERTIDLLLAAGADRESRDANGETPLAWGSWYGRPDPILRRLCYGPHSIRSDRKSMRAYLLGRPSGTADRLDRGRRAL